MGNFIKDFFEGPDVENFNDPYKAQLDQIMGQLSSGQLGKQVASNSTGFIRRQAEDNLRTISNSGAGRNAAALSRLTDKNSTTADQGIINAQLSGAQINQSALGQAAQIGETNRQFEYNDFERKDAQRRQPSPFESLLGTAVGAVAGGLTGGVSTAVAGLLGRGGGNKGPGMNNYSTPQTIGAAGLNLGMDDYWRGNRNQGGENESGGGDDGFAFPYLYGHR